MNPTLHVYFGRDTLVHRFRESDLLNGKLLPNLETRPSRAHIGFRRLLIGRNELCTAVDSTLQVLLRRGPNSTFVFDRSSFEKSKVREIGRLGLFSSPFGATARVGR